MQARLTEASLFPNGPLNRLGSQVFVFDKLDSTNTYLLARAADLADGTVVCAEVQTAGRGRMGRRWEAPRGSSILLSVLLHEPPESPLTGRATLLAALAMCEAVELAVLCRPGVRWPNDVMLSSRKLGGVLVESSSIPRRAAGRAIVIGIGLNCLQQRGHFTGELARTATSLEIESAQPVHRAAVAAGLLEHLDTHLTSTRSQPDAWNHLLETWKSHCEDIGTRVTLRHDRREYSGTVLDISNDGDLLVHLDEGGRRYFASATTTRLR